MSGLQTHIREDAQMTPRATTGIVLTHNHSANTLLLEQPGKPNITFQDADCTHLDEVSGHAKLAEGYWLRQHRGPSVTIYTWMQL